MPRKKQSLVEDMVNVASRLPWHVSLILGALAYFGFHYVSSMPPPTVAPGTANVGALLAGTFLRTAASVMQYLVPFAFGLGALVAVYRRHRQSVLHANVAASPDRSALERLSWREFELLTAEVFRREGFAVIERGGRGPDGGVDVELKMGSDKYLVQCKQWKSQKVGVATVRELYGVMAAESAVGGFVVASGAFTVDAHAFAEGRAIKLVHTEEILRLVSETRSHPATPPTADMVPSQPAGVIEGRKQSAALVPPSCPKCGASMVLRSSKKAGNTGDEFWGCSTFPRCRGILKKI